MGTKTHELKTWTFYFDQIIDGSKPFEIRKNDKNYQEGDQVSLKDWDRYNEKFTGKECLVQITCIVQGGQFGIKAGYCVFGFRMLKSVTETKKIICTECKGFGLPLHTYGYDEEINDIHGKNCNCCIECQDICNQEI